jgi:arginase
MPIMLGGDHCLAIGSISAVARHCREKGKKLRVLWFDAHADFNTATLTPSGNIHGMPVACLCGHGPKELVELVAIVTGPRCSPKQIRQIGIRSVDEGEKRWCTTWALKCSTCVTSTKWACATPWSWRWPW